MKIVIVGAGEVGFHIASHLAHENKDVVVVDKNADALRRVSDNIDVQVILGSGSSPLRVRAGAGLVEHLAHEEVTSTHGEPSDHRPVSVILTPRNPV